MMVQLLICQVIDLLFIDESVFAGFGVDEFVFEEFAEGFEDFFGFFACFIDKFLECLFSVF